MEAPAYAHSAPHFGMQVPKLCNARTPGTRFGKYALLGFLAAQCLDGLFTYAGVRIYGLSIEANPIIAALILEMGDVPALATAKLGAGRLGFGLYLQQVHAAVALLAGFYLVAAILPWTLVLFS